MKKLLCALLTSAMLCGCAAAPIQTAPPAPSATEDSPTVRFQVEKGGLTVTAPDGMAENAVTAANDIIYYEEGCGEPGQAHSAEEAARHTVVHINAPGTYVLSGRLGLGQIAVDLGEDAKNDPAAVVTLILDGVDITCTVAPAIIFYNVYECGDAENPTANVDTSAAGANVILAEDSQNYVNGSHTEDYDGALYSKMSMNMGGEGSLFITADNESLCSEMHLTVNSGDISIESGNDGINTNEDGVSVTTINGGHLRITVTGETGEGDGIDSNGSIVIGGGVVEAFACADSMDSGIDADLGISFKGGIVVATGNMLDRIEDSSQTHAVFSFAQPQTGGSYTLKNEKGDALFDITVPNGFSGLIFSSPDLTEGTYTLWSGDIQFEGISGFSGSGFADFRPGDRPEFPGRDDGRVEIPPQPTVPIVPQGTVQNPPQGDRPEDMPIGEPPGGFDPSQMPVPPMPAEGENMPMPQLPEGVEPPQDGFGRQPIGSVVIGVLSTDFPITSGANYFTGLRPVE